MPHRPVGPDGQDRGGPGHPWTGRAFSGGWGSAGTLDVVLVEPAVMVEVSVDAAVGTTGWWRHPVCVHRARTDLAPEEVDPPPAP
ncbi:hypothetical protein [Streptomyces sp. WELS2]|uniref:hypothetical protein n=1 Tax=Streptomyces sp. WELS2 TaxID=2749435 RepID=UPI0015F0DB81|nr:hypothetical protein [Streptomyces sp. WELS2]